MAFDVNIIKFTGGALQGQYGILVDRKLQVFALYDCNGEFLNTWQDGEVSEEEFASGNDGYEASPLAQWFMSHPYRFWGMDVEDAYGLPASVLAALARVATTMSEQVNQTAVCLPDNLFCFTSKSLRATQQEAATDDAARASVDASPGNSNDCDRPDA